MSGCPTSACSGLRPAGLPLKPRRWAGNMTDPKYDSLSETLRDLALETEGGEVKRSPRQMDVERLGIKRYLGLSFLVLFVAMLAMAALPRPTGESILAAFGRRIWLVFIAFGLAKRVLWKWLSKATTIRSERTADQEFVEKNEDRFNA